MVVSSDFSTGGSSVGSSSVLSSGISDFVSLEITASVAAGFSLPKRFSNFDTLSIVSMGFGFSVRVDFDGTGFKGAVLFLPKRFSYAETSFSGSDFSCAFSRSVSVSPICSISVWRFALPPANTIPSISMG